MADEYKYDVFISYSHKDEDWVVNTLLPALEKAGLKVCIDYRDFEVGIPSLVNMENAIEFSHHTVTVLTPNWIESEWSDFESLLTGTSDPTGRRKKLIPIMLEKCQPPKRISMLTWVDFTRKDREDIAWRQLLKACEAKIDITPKTGSSVEPKGRKVDTPIPMQSINSQQGESIYNAPGGTININRENTQESFPHNQGFVLPKLELKLIDNMKQYVDQLIFLQTINHQEFRFGIALINNEENSPPAEKLDITVEFSWDGIDIDNAPKVKTDTHGRTTPGWIATREIIQQSEIPYPATLSFHGSADDQCAYGHNLEWYRFRVVLFERMNGRFILNYRISSAYLRSVNSKGSLFIIVDSGKFGTKSVNLNDILSGEELRIEFNLSTDEFEINGVRVKRVPAFESNENQFVFSPVESDSQILYHLSRKQIEWMKSI